MEMERIIIIISAISFGISFFIYSWKYEKIYGKNPEREIATKKSIQEMNQFYKEYQKKFLNKEECLKIQILDPVWSKIDRKDIGLIAPCLTYQEEIWLPGAYKREKKKINSCMINKASGRFLTGFIPRIEKYCQLNRIYFETNEMEYLSPDRGVILNGITLRKDQQKIINTIIIEQKGIIKNATGTGKTVLAGAICSAYKNKKIVFLCHTLDLLKQTEKAFKNFGIENVVVIGGGNKDFYWEDKPTVLVSTVQTFRKMDIENHYDWADIIIIDECHHLTQKSSMYAEILSKSLALMRIGLSAELPKTERGRLTLEGYIGPVIGEFNYQEAMEAGVLAKPLLNLIPVPYSDEIGEIKRYGNTTNQHGKRVKGIYQKGIMENRTRNRLALSEAIKSKKIFNESVLILTGTATEHGFILQEMAKELFDEKIPFIYGDMKKEERARIQEQLEQKEEMIVISNVVWKEGINIKSLNHVINVGGEKSPTQIAGRGSRTTETKKTFKITDFLDPYNYLSHHTVLRLVVYAKEGWLNIPEIIKGEM